MNLRERTQQLSNNLPFMNDREKGEVKTLLNEIVTVDNFGFMNDEDGDYVCFTIKEQPKKFFFGGMVLTDDMHQLEADGYRDEIESDGLPIRMIEKKSKNKKTYTKVEYYPE